MVKEHGMANGTPSVVDLNAELAKLTMFCRTPGSTAADREGSVAQLASYRDGLLLAIKAAGKDHWERHLTGDELVRVLDGAATLEIACTAGPPQSFALVAGTIAVVPQGVWHHLQSSRGFTQLVATPFPGETIELDVDDPRTAERPPETETASGSPRIVDLDAELAKLTMFRGRTPQSTIADRKGSAARLASYRDGTLTASKFSGKGHWEAHIADELIHILDGAAILDIVNDDGSRSFALAAGILAVIPRGTWHRFHSLDGVTLMTATPFPSEVIEVDVDDPRTVERKPA